MKKNTDLELNQTIENLIEDPNFSRRIASRILIQAASLERKKTKPVFMWKAIAAVSLLGLGTLFAAYILSNQRELINSYAGLSNPAAELVASPHETEYIWETTDTIIETSFGER